MICWFLVIYGLSWLTWQSCRCRTVGRRGNCYLGLSATSATWRMRRRWWNWLYCVSKWAAFTVTLRTTSATYKMQISYNMAADVADAVVASAYYVLVRFWRGKRWERTSSAYTASTTALLDSRRESSERSGWQSLCMIEKGAMSSVAVSCRRT